MKPICVTCQRFFSPKENGFYFLEGMPKVQEAKPGTLEPQKWVPYKLWSGDLWECLGCGTMIVVGTGHSPIAEHYEAEFLKTVDRLNATQLQVNDC